MLSYSIVIPTFERLNELKTTINSVLRQSIKPLEVIVVNNNTNRKERIDLKNYINTFKKNEIPFFHIFSPINSGAIARNIGAREAKGDYILFLDSDVILDIDYAKNILLIFNKDQSVIGAQGVDIVLQKIYDKSQKTIFYFISLYLEKIFHYSWFFKKGKPSVYSSLAITHPDPPYNFNLESEWISTCAGFFKRSIFEKYEFCSKFITFSNNEYIYLSNSLFKAKEGKLIYTSTAKYEGIITSKGRLANKDLQYMIEAYDLYIFMRIFKLNFNNIILFAWSRVGRIIIFYLQILKKFNYYFLRQNKKNQFLYKPNRDFLLPFKALFYALKNFNSIKRGDLSFYKNDFGE